MWFGIHLTATKSNGEGMRCWSRTIHTHCGCHHDIVALYSREGKYEGSIVGLKYCTCLGLDSSRYVGQEISQLVRHFISVLGI